MWVVKKRFSEERHYISDFVTPDAPDVSDLAHALGKDDIAETIEGICKWVWGNVKYPSGALSPDWFELKGFTSGLFKPIFKFTTGDMWLFPSEVLGWSKNGKHWADCEDNSFLCCSLLRNHIPPEKVHVALGKWSPYYHAWVEVDYNGWYILEMTKEHLPVFSKPVPQDRYIKYGFFNDEFAQELQEGFFDTLAEVGQREKAEYLEKMSLLIKV